MRAHHLFAGMGNAFTIPQNIPEQQENLLWTI